MSRPKLSPDQLDEMAMLRERGWAVDRIARHFTDAGTPISGSAINWQCMRVGADVPNRMRGRSVPAEVPYMRYGRPVRPWTNDEDRRLLSMRAEGEPYNRIREALGRANSSIRGRLLTLARRDARAEDAIA